MAAAREEEVVFLERSSRATRGTRMNKLLDEEIQDDEQFWNQDALKEDDNDDSYEEEPDAVDVYDSDFNEDEPEPEEAEDEGKERVKTKKKLIYPGKKASKKKVKRQSESKVVISLEVERIDDQVEDSGGAHADRIVRKSTRTSVIVRQAERDAVRAALQATMRPMKKKKEGEEKKMTQEEMLLEAAQTEIRNLRNLERVLAREEEVNKKAFVHKEVYSGPSVRYSSKDGETSVEFLNGLSFQSELCTAAPPYPEKVMCAVTGLPARYRDPKTGLPYATLDAFKIIRQRFLNGGELQRDVQLGPLFTFVPGGVVSARSQRSTLCRKAATSPGWGSWRL